MIGLRIEQPCLTLNMTTTSEPFLNPIIRATRAGIWFDDGNIILVAEDMLFKVHRGLLSQRSQVFRDIVSIPRSPKPEESHLLDGVPLIRVIDKWKDLSYVLSAL